MIPHSDEGGVEGLSWLQARGQPPIKLIFEGLTSALRDCPEEITDPLKYGLDVQTIIYRDSGIN